MGFPPNTSLIRDTKTNEPPHISTNAPPRAANPTATAVSWTCKLSAALGHFPFRAFLTCFSHFSSSLHAFSRVSPALCLSSLRAFDAAAASADAEEIAERDKMYEL